MDTYQIIFLSLLGLGLIGFLVMVFSKKNYLTYLNLASPILGAVYNVLTVTYNLFPTEAWKTATLVLKATIEGVAQAEKLWKTGELDKEERTVAANSYIMLMLSTANITITPTIQTIIDGAIKVICAIMPHADPQKQI